MNLNIILNNTKGSQGRLYDIWNKQGFIWLPEQQKGLQATDGKPHFQLQERQQSFINSLQILLYLTICFYKITGWRFMDGGKIQDVIRSCKEKLTESFTGSPINNELIYHIVKR